MKFPHLSIFFVLSLALVATHAALLPPEIYWKSKLPTTQMPKAITDLLHPAGNDNVNDNSQVSKPQLNRDNQIPYDNSQVSKPQLNRDNIIPFFYRTYGNSQVSKPQLNKVNIIPFFYRTYGNSQVSKPQLNKVNIIPFFYRTYGNSQVSKPQLNKVNLIPFIYRTYGNSQGSKLQLHATHNMNVFFFEKDLHLGAKFNKEYTKESNYGATFLTREVANSIPFSSNKLENILDHFSIKKDSTEYEHVKQTITQCEDHELIGEEKTCATSLESMVDFVTSILGNNVEAVSTEVMNKENTELQQYTVAKAVKILGEVDKVVGCHLMSYPYAVFYCHKIDATTAYSVYLEGVNGNRVKDIAVCHSDTSKWNPELLVFQLLKTTPGAATICHFLPQDDIVWVPKNSNSNQGQFQSVISDI